MLSEKQKKTADHFLQFQNQVEALKYGGYSEKYKAFFSLKEVQEYIIENCPTVATSQEILEYLSRIMRGEEMEEVPQKEKGADGKTIITVVKQPIALATRIKVAEMIGKRLGTFVEESKNEGVLPVVVKDDLRE